MASGDDTEPVDLEPFMDQALDPDACFLCGVVVDDSNRTREHVFPKWLLNRHDLHNARFTLLNGTIIPYGQLTVTCCQPCNGTHLSQLEQEIGEAFAAGADAVRALPEERLFLWLAKFYYGVVFRELTLAADQRTPGSPSIMSDEVLRGYAIHHLLLRRVLGIVEWTEFPGSIFIFDALDSGPQDFSFDYFDALDIPFVCIRSGSTFVVAFLQDFGAVHHLGLEDFQQVSAARSLALHPMQCLELMAFFYTVAKTRSRVPKFIIGKTGDVYQVFVMGALSGRSPYSDWDEDLYLHVLIDMFKGRFGIDIGRGHAGGTIPTLLVSSRGEPIQAPSADWMPEVWDDPALLPPET